MRSPLPRRGDPTLLERDRELATLEALIAGAAAGHARVALIEGAPGIGKSGLLAEARARASASGLGVLSARAGELERDFPFSVVRQLFEPVLVDSDLHARWLSGAAGPARAVFGSAGGEDAKSGESVSSFAALHGLYWLAVNAAADAPLMLAIDDLHWCDRSSLRLIAYLVRRLEGLPVFIATTLRPSEPSADVMLVGEVAHDPATVSLRPQALSEAAVGTLIGERLGMDSDRAFSAACHEATAGNPLLLSELLKTLDAERVEPDAAHADVVRDIGPRAVSWTVLLRLARMPADCVPVARALAVLGAGAGLPALAALAELDEQRAAEAIRALTDAEIVGSEPPVRFVHPLVREAIYRELSPGERELWHARAADTLVAGGAPAEQIAAQLLCLSPPRSEPWVAELLRDAGRAAMVRGAADSAVACLTRALEEPAPAGRQAELLLDLGMAHALTDGTAAMEYVGAAREALDDPLARGRAAQLLARILYFLRPPDEAAALAREAAAELPDELADLRQGLEAFELYGVAFGASDADDAEARLDRARTQVGGGGLGERALMSVAAWRWALAGGGARECAELALAALAGGVLVRSDPEFMTFPAAGVLVLAERDAAFEAFEATIVEGHRRGSVMAVSGVHLWRGFAWLERGELAEAELSLHQAIEDTIVWEGSEDEAGGPYNVAFLARVLCERGGLAAAREALERCGAAYPRSDGDTLCRRAEVELLLAEGRPAEALEAVDEYAARLGGAVNPAWAPWRSLKAQALAGADRPEEALALAEHEVALARRWGAPGTVGRALRVLGTLRAGDGLELLGEAVTLTERSPARLEHAKALAALGTALRHARRPAEARGPLGEALRIASSCGAQPLADRARAELYAAGGRPRRRSAADSEAMTPSERRVADLAAAGRSNRAIAQELFVTPKTVEVHLSSVYRKLGIRSRTMLADALSASV